MSMGFKIRQAWVCLLTLFFLQSGRQQIPCTESLNIHKRPMRLNDEWGNEGSQSS